MGIVALFTVKSNALIVSACAYKNTDNCLNTKLVELAKTVFYIHPASFGPLYYNTQ